MPYQLPLQVLDLRAKLRRAERRRLNQKHNRNKTDGCGPARAGWPHEAGRQPEYRELELSQVAQELATADWLGVAELSALAEQARREE